jgi:hypothetical protein
MDKWTSSAMARRCADRYLLRQQFQTRRWISKHYKTGFRDAFMDVANGESGEVPAVPPPKYWNTHYRTEKGKQCVEQYFDGYRSGSALAAAEMNTMKTIGASYDWSIEKPKQPCASSAMLAGNCGHGGACSTGQGCALGGGYSPGNPSFAGQMPTFPQGMPSPMRLPSVGFNVGKCQSSSHPFSPFSLSKIHSHQRRASVQPTDIPHQTITDAPHFQTLDSANNGTSISPRRISLVPLPERCRNNRRATQTPFRICLLRRPTVSIQVELRICHRQRCQLLVTQARVETLGLNRHRKIRFRSRLTINRAASRNKPDR